MLQEVDCLVGQFSITSNSKHAKLLLTSKVSLLSTYLTHMLHIIE